MENKIKGSVAGAIMALYGTEVSPETVQVQKTKKEFEGDLTVVVFPFLRLSKKKPEDTASELGNWLKENDSEIAAFNVIKGFLNLSISKATWVDALNNVAAAKHYGMTSADEDSPLVMVEYSSPNTNKPLHLGHIRNNLLGFSVSEILKANGNKVVKTNIVNDRGIHICKSMLAWDKFGEGETPESSGLKGDHLVGKYYVKFDKEYKAELAKLKASGLSEKEAEVASELMKEAREMLRKWEAKDPEVYALWQKMNTWVYDGFDVTYKKLGVDFDKIYYESETYLEGKETVLEGVEKGVFQKEADGSVWADFTDEGLDKKILLRSDGTSVYMTQDIGTAKLRFDDYPIDKMIYVVGNEQIYHFQVLSKLLDKVGFSWGKDLVHFSYGMVELPEGKMKSREGTVVDADDLIQDMIDNAREISQELGKLDGYSEKEAETVYEIVALGALKYFMLKVDPRKNMTFNPKESIDFNGNTGPFIQYTYARINSVIKRAVEMGYEIPQKVSSNLVISDKEADLIQKIAGFSDAIKTAAEMYSPAIIANYVYDLVKDYNKFYQQYSILKEENKELLLFRLLLSQQTALNIKNGFKLLGIEVPERM